jgi:hypothetical protein
MPRRHSNSIPTSRLRSSSERRDVVGIALVAAIVLVGACSGSEDDSTVASTGTVAVATLPAVAATVATTTIAGTTIAGTASTIAPAAAVSTSVATSVSSVPASTAPASNVSTTTSIAAAPTTVPVTVPAPPCNLDLIVQQTQTVYEGITPSDLQCADDWAAWIGRPDDELSDGFFAVARWNGDAWELMNLGTAGICADAGIPEELFARLGCFE